MVYPTDPIGAVAAWLCPMHAVMEIVRYTIGEVTLEGNLGGSVCIFSKPMIFPSV